MYNSIHKCMARHGYIHDGKPLRIQLGCIISLQLHILLLPLTASPVHAELVSESFGPSLHSETSGSWHAPCCCCVFVCLLGCISSCISNMPIMYSGQPQQLGTPMSACTRIACPAHTHARTRSNEEATAATLWLAHKAQRRYDYYFLPHFPAPPKSAGQLLEVPGAAPSPSHVHGVPEYADGIVLLKSWFIIALPALPHTHHCCIIIIII